MRPVLHAGDLLLGLRWFRPRVGQIVVAAMDRQLVKRIVRLKEDLVWLEGDNAEASTDSRDFGPVTRSSLEAVVVKKLP
jgi:type IV secretory pathway protease TraF